MKYHWVLTIQWGGPPNVIKSTYTFGIYTPRRGQPRSDIFLELFKSAIAQGKEPGFHDPVPLFFSLEPEDLEAE